MINQHTFLVSLEPLGHETQTTAVTKVGLADASIDTNRQLSRGAPATFEAAAGNLLPTTAGPSVYLFARCARAKGVYHLLTVAGSAAVSRCSRLNRESPDQLKFAILVLALQGYLAHKKLSPPRTLH